MKRFLMLTLMVALASLPCVLFVTCSKKGDSQITSDKMYNSASNMKGNATIVGVDTRDCTSCGGYFISIDNSKPIAGDYFLTYEFPGGYKPQKFPVRVYIEWKKDLSAGVNDKITIVKITVLNS